MSTLVEPRLKSSTKSFVNGAPELPPPAKSWLTTRSGEALCAAGAASKVPAIKTARREERRTRCMDQSNREGERVRHLVSRRGAERKCPFSNRRGSVTYLLRGPAGTDKNPPSTTPRRHDGLAPQRKLFRDVLVRSVVPVHRVDGPRREQ